ncbi:aldehyde dehydrogenase family protein [Solimicrobium silvestre]|uniref:NAD-dependent aldehyde dehydrogenase n=1 Tax=Solimicrobium silvestre TaxID=2099400 RepID=A0A2S9GTB1_9BURK|nr:aldehyde dehydrogenase family protein [Solimicrobium silvestre]PRC90928.1 NAD-dependent aldehyde dehydrogenase [Solimicrobium silvestre]
MNQEQLFINGTWQPARRGRHIDVINPATDTVFATIAAADSDDVADAVHAAKTAFDSGPWPRMSGSARAQVLHKISAAILDQLDKLAELEVRDNGKPLPEARWDISDAAACFTFYADMAEQEERREPELPALPDARFNSQVVRDPVGVVGAIIPWNYPLLMAAWKVAPALAAGCTVVLKPSELTSLTALALADITQQAGLPAGVLNIITGFGSVAGQALISHPAIDKLAFTGSRAIGSVVMQAAAQDIKRVSLELGGKSPLIVFGDSDIDKALEWILFGIFWNQGQVCSATSRVLIERTLYPQLLARLTSEAKRIVIGNGMHEKVQLGPLISREHHQKVCAAIDRALADGATLITGGSTPPANNHSGYFLAPTILADMGTNSWIWNEEVFGPVLCVMPFDTEEEAVTIANNSRYGLAAAVMSTDLARCDRVAQKLRAGIVWINCSQPTFVEAPWGGFKQSGIGRELGRWGFENYLETKQITRFDSSQPWGWYLKK